MRIYMMERFLERLAQSEYRDNFIIKGGILVTAMIGVAHRSTMDILHENGAFVTQTALGFDGEATRKMRAFLQGPKPELLHHQKFFENGTAERAKESGTEQNYNMIDDCVNNVPKKPRRIGGRWSVLDRLHIKQAERRQKDNTPQQEQERSRKS